MERLRDRKKWNLRERLFFNSILPITLVLLIGTAVSVSAIVTTASASYHEDVVYEANLNLQELEGYFERYYLMVEEASHNRSLEMYLKTLRDERDYSANPYYGEVSEVLDSVADSQAIDREEAALFWLADFDAQIMLEDSDSGVLKTARDDGWSNEERIWYEDSLEAGGIFFTRPYVTAGLGRVVSSVMATIRDSRTGEALGVIGMDIEMDKLARMIENRNGERNFLMLVDQDGLILYHEDPDKVLQKCQDLEYYSSIERQLWSNEQETCRFRVEGEPMTGVVQRIDRVGWMVISAIPMRELYDSLRRLVLPVILICLLAIAAVIGVSCHFADASVIGPLKEIEKAMVSIINQDPSYELKNDNQDEIGNIASVLNKEVKWLFEDLEEKNQRIGESMEYAKVFQEQMFPPKEQFLRIFREYDSFYSPAEAVGGDFVWCYLGKRGNLWVIGDCTGHSVSGALLSVIIIVMLTNVVKEHNCHDLKAILLEIDSQLFRIFRSGSSRRGVDIAPGMDVGMLFLSDEGTMDFLGGNVDLYVESGGAVRRIKGERLHIGGGKSKEIENALVRRVEREEENSYFIATDGFFEQTGGKKRYSYGHKRFKEAFGKIHGLDAEAAMSAVKREWLEYKGAERQKDDVTAVCFKVTG